MPLPCTPAALNATSARYQCQACDAYSTLDTTTGYFDRTIPDFVDDPFCDGICMYYFNQGMQLEVRWLWSGSKLHGFCLDGE